MKLVIDTQKLNDPNEFGELLRNYCFIPNKIFKSGYGCYSIFDLRKEFIKVRKESIVGTLMITYLIGNGDTKYKKEVYDRIEIYSNTDIYIAWYWDGDGTLLIKEKNKIAINTDCKCGDGWRWINE